MRERCSCPWTVKPSKDGETVRDRRSLVRVVGKGDVVRGGIVGRSSMGVVWAPEGSEGWNLGECHLFSITDALKDYRTPGVEPGRELVGGKIMWKMKSSLARVSRWWL